MDIERKIYATTLGDVESKLLIDSVAYMLPAVEAETAGDVKAEAVLVSLAVTLAE